MGPGRSPAPARGATPAQMWPEPWRRCEAESRSRCGFEGLTGRAHFCSSGVRPARPRRARSARGRVRRARAGARDVGRAVRLADGTAIIPIISTLSAIIRALRALISTLISIIRTLISIISTLISIISTLGAIISTLRPSHVGRAVRLADGTAMRRNARPYPECAAGIQPEFKRTCRAVGV